MRRMPIILAWVMIGCLISAGVAEAHKVSIFAWVEGGTVYTESKFSGGKKVNGGKVEVFDKAGTLLLEGQTDPQGQFSFPVPKVGDLNIVLTAGMGHKNSWLLTAADMGLGDAKPAPQPPSAAAPGAVEPAVGTAPAGPGLSAQEVEAIVSRQLDQKLQPLARTLALAQDKGVTFGDVIGGIGYIIGLVGLGAYVRYRRQGHGS
jgi:nickel transport protein